MFGSNTQETKHNLKLERRIYGHKPQTSLSTSRT